MRRFSAMNTAMTAAACHAADRSACANAHIAITMDAALLASIFVALLNLLGLICLPLILVSLLVLLALRTTHCRLKDTTFA